MATATIYATIPAVAAAVGIYLFDKTQSKTQETRGMIQTCIQNLVTKANEEAKTTPKLAPEFDGLHSFETLVSH